MDLNYLFYRQQIERSLAEAAGSAAARKIHEELAAIYEEEIGRAWTPDGEPRLRDPIEAPKANPILAVAITAREVGTD